MKQVTDYIEYNMLVEKYKQKNCACNDYLQKEVADIICHDCLFVLEGKSNCFLFVKKDIGMRLYYYINDFNETVNFAGLKDIVIEILFRGVIPKQEVEFFIHNGFRVNLIRDQYAGLYMNLVDNITHVSGIRIEKAETLLNVKTACKLFNESFDALSGDFIPERDYKNLLENGSILIAWDDNKQHFLGALHQVKEGAVNIIGHVAVMKHARGMGVGKALIDAFVQDNMETEKTRYQLWVQRQNDIAVKMYQNKGFKFINKSTISLIK